MDTSSVQMQAKPFPLSRVRLLDGPFKERQDVLARYLLTSVDPDRLLVPFRVQAGLPVTSKRYGGWESMGINGHSLGHYLSALSYLNAATGDAHALERVNHIVAELADCQKANGDGYVMSVPKSVYEEVRVGHIKASGFGLNGVWVPNYTLHKVMAGLRDAYRLGGNRQALEIELKLANYIEGVLAGLDDSQIQTMLQAEHGGMNEVMTDLAADTGEKRFLRLADRGFTHKAVLDPLRRGEDKLDGQHGNTQIPKVIGLADEYELTGEPTLRAASEFFWDNVVHQRSFANGGHGESEHFFPTHLFPDKLTPHTCETCNTYNMLKLTSHLFAWEPKAERMDFVERALINHLLANIGRAPGEFGYFLGLSSVGMKVFSTPFDSWWCCVGTGMENPARYGEQVYSRSDDTLWVNLFMGSELNWTEKGVKVRQETRFPDDDTVHVTFTCEKPVSFTLNLRHPNWCDQPVIKVNGEALTAPSSLSSYVSLSRTWKTGDVLDLHLPMSLHLDPLPHSDGRIVAVMYGPMVLAGVIPPEPGVPDPAKQRFVDHIKARGKTDQFPPVFVVPNSAAVVSGLIPTGRSFAEFRSQGLVQTNDLIFVPFHRIYEEHYAVYFPVMTTAEWAQKETVLRLQQEKRKQLAAATLDEVTPGFQQSEVEHNLQSENSGTGEFHDRKWRDARGGWFSYDMAVDSAGPMALVCTYWGGERDVREFDLLIDGKRIASQRLRANRPGVFFDETYVVPRDLTKGRTRVTVRFEAHRGSTAGGVFGLRMMKRDIQSREGLK